VETISLEVKKPWENFQLVRIPEMKENIKFYDFQAYAIYQALNKSRYILGFATGLGKSITSLATFFYYRKVYPNTKLLIITKTSAMYQFAEETDKFFNHGLNIRVAHASSKELKNKKNYKNLRKELFLSWGSISSAPEIIVTNYPMLRIEKETIQSAVCSLRKAGHQVFLVLDEATMFKNLASQTSKAVYTIQSYCERVLSLTATLTKGKIEEMYNLFKGVGLLLAQNKKEFEKQYCIIWQHPQYFYIRSIQGYKNIETLKFKIEPYSLIVKKSDAGASLPKFQFQKRILEHSEEQMELIKEIYTGLLNTSNDPIDFSNITAMGDLKDAKILQQLSETGYVKRALISPEIVAPDRFQENCPKTVEILEMLEEEFSDEKIVIYTPSKKYLKILKKEISACKSLPDHYRHPFEICGDVSPEVRYEYQQKFSQPEGNHNIMIIDNAGTEAINLQAASVMIITSLPDTAGDLLQLVGRIRRIGSKHTNLLLIYLLHENSQDMIEYQIVMQQLLLFQGIHGESEEGLLDLQAIKGKDSDISDEDFVSKSVQYLILKKRESLAKQYI